MALRIAVFGSGAVLMALEVLAFRVIGKTFGTALRETSAVIAVFLASMSCGYYLGGRLGDRSPRALTLVLPMLGAGAFIEMVPLLDAWLAPRVSVSSLPLGLHAIVACLALFAAPSLLMAGVSPIAIRLLSRAVEQTGKTAGSVAALSTVGSIAGTLLAGFWLIDLFQSVALSIYALGVAMFVLAAIAALGSRSTGRLAVLAFLALSAGCTAARAAVVYERDSAYHHIVVRDEGDVRILYFDNAPQSRMSLADPVSGAYEYTDFFHCALLFKPDIRDVLFLGLGGGSAPKRFHHDYPHMELDVVDIDAAVIEVAQRYFHVRPGPRLRLIEQDARVYIKRCKKTYDLVVLDAYTTNRYGSSIPSHLTTRQFFAEVSACLQPGGVVAYNVTGEVSGLGSAMTRALVKTMSTQFTSPYLFAAASSRNTVILAFKGTRHTLDRSVLVRRARSLVRSGRVRLPQFEVRAGRMVPLPNLQDALLLTDDYAPVDRLLMED